MKVVAKIIYSALSASLKHGFFKALLGGAELQFSDLIPHTEIRWLNWSKIVSRIMGLIP
jgi:hypothetical protein